MTIQAFGILKKIAEVDRLMTPELQKRVYEAHPELAFRLLAGRSMQFKKSRSSGRDERIRALAQLGTTFNGLGERWVDRRMTFSGKDLAADDLLDAYALTWTAFRIATGEARRLPSDPPRDRKGLRMEVWY